MDLCERFQADIQKTLYVTGVEQTCTDDDIHNVFVANGKVSKIIRVPDEPHQPQGRTLVVYESEQAILKIDPITLGELTSPVDPNANWFSKTVRDITQEEVGKEVARRYLRELEVLGGSGKAGFLSFPQSELQVDPTPQTDTQRTVDQNINTSIPDTEPNSWDCVATCFFIDTAHNVIDYIETIWNILKPGGVWINLGPLLYHFENMANELSIELSYEDVRAAIIKYGFDLEVERESVQTTYTENTCSMLKYLYDCVFFVARKPAHLYADTNGLQEVPEGCSAASSPRRQEFGDSLT